MASTSITQALGKISTGSMSLRSKIVAMRALYVEIANQTESFYKLQVITDNFKKLFENSTKEDIESLSTQPQETVSMPKNTRREESVSNSESKRRRKNNSDDDDIRYE